VRNENANGVPVLEANVIFIFIFLVFCSNGMIAMLLILRLENSLSFITSIFSVGTNNVSNIAFSPETT